MRTIAAVLTGKLISYFSKNFKIGGGSAAPGLYALKIEPDLINKLSRNISKNVVITGTNGKTTTSKMLAHFTRQNGLKIIRNHTGSNLERGIASTLIQNSRFRLKGVELNFDLGIWELDEAAFNTVAPKLKPDIVIFLNVFRDQLDRYGEVDSVLNKWSQTLKNLPAKTLILANGDDLNISKLVSSFKGNVQKFGVKDYKIIGESIEHLKEKEVLNFEAKNVKLDGLKGSRFEIFLNHKSYLLHLPLPGVYHIYDTLAAFACAHQLNLSIRQLADSLKSYSPAFGRVEKIDKGYIFLIKNPVGATQVFQTIAPNIKTGDRLLLALNDNLADGTDVSWIWDADFEKLIMPRHPELVSGSKSKMPKQVRYDIIVSGTRAYDLALRLKYAGIDTKTTTVEPSLEKALKEARKGLEGRLYILPTYTAMLELQSLLVKAGTKNPYWEVES